MEKGDQAWEFALDGLLGGGDSESLPNGPDDRLGSVEWLNGIARIRQFNRLVAALDPAVTVDQHRDLGRPEG